MFFDLVTLLRPDCLKLLMAARGMAEPPPGQALHPQCRDALAALRLTPAQRRGLVAEWRAFRERQAELAGAAGAAAAGVAAAAPAAAAGPALQPAAGGQQIQQLGLLETAAAAPAAAASQAAWAPAASLAAQVDQYLRLAGHAGQLAAAADARWASLLAFSDAAWYMLTPLQGARLLAACRPSYPDPIQLARALEEEEAAALAAAAAPAAAAVAAAAESGAEAGASSSSSQPPGASAEEAADGGEAEAGAAPAHSWWRQAAERRGGSAAAPSGQAPSTLLSWTCPA